MTVCNGSVRWPAAPVVPGPQGIPGAAAAGQGRELTRYEATVRLLSDRLVAAQRPIRVLDSIAWSEEIEAAFFAAGARQLPPVTRETYNRRRLAFDPQRKRDELLELECDVGRLLGNGPAGHLLKRACVEYRGVATMLEQRGMPGFGALSAQLYGSAFDRLHTGGPRLIDLARRTASRLHQRIVSPGPRDAEAVFCDTETVEMLSARLADYFGGPGAVHVKLSDGIVADAAAGSDYLKVRRGTRFTAREVRLLEVHEGWVHLGTTLNGQAQPICTFLSKGPPSATLTQEGLAVLTELLALASCPARVRRLVNRIEGVARAEAGANFLDVYRFFREEGHDERASYQQTMRIFRGGLPDRCGPFTKDICYGKGLLLVAGFVRRALKMGQAPLIPLLFCGKTNLHDLDALAQLVAEGLVVPPRYLPPPFADRHGLAAALVRRP